jgi:hypothetical protein
VLLKQTVEFVEIRYQLVIPLRAEAKVRKIMKASRSLLASGCDYNSINMAGITFHFKKSH